MRSKQWGIYTQGGYLLEGGFFSKAQAIRVRDRDYPGGIVRRQD